LPLFAIAALACASLAYAQGGAAPVGDAAAADDPFAAFDDFDDAFDEGGRKLEWSGFVETAVGRKLDRDARFATRESLGEIRARLETEWANDALVATLKAEALYDDYASDFDVDAREASLRLSPGGAVDLKIGRQVLTWGTGDLVFLNDLFPKSWVSFFSGRDDEYLKAPSDAVRATWYTERVNVDAVWAPRFAPDDYLTGERFAFFLPFAGGVVAPNPPLAGIEPDGRFENGELALRFFKTLRSVEYAGYAYRGFFKRPLGANAAFEPTFPALAVYGASMRRPLASGVLNVELAYHDSRDDGDGTRPLIPNGQLRALVGFELEARPRFTVALQYYVERTQDYAALIASSMAPELEPARTRHLVTNRLTYRSARDTLTLSLFTFYSPTDDDHYLRPVVSYRKSDRLSFTAGANVFGGEREHTFFGQLEDNSNVYFRARFAY
jgi:hypothetical protein